MRHHSAPSILARSGNVTVQYRWRCLFGPLTVRLLRPLDGTDLTAGATLVSTLSAFASGTCSADTGIVVVDIFRAAEGKRRDDLVDFLRSYGQSLEHEVSEFGGILVAEEREDDWEEEVIRDVEEVILATVHRDRAAVDRHIEAMANRIGQVSLHAGPPTSLALLPTMRSPMRYR